MCTGIDLEVLWSNDRRLLKNETTDVGKKIKFCAVPTVKKFVLLVLRNDNDHVCVRRTKNYSSFFKRTPLTGTTDLGIVDVVKTANDARRHTGSGKRCCCCCAATSGRRGRTRRGVFG